MAELTDDLVKKIEETSDDVRDIKVETTLEQLALLSKQCLQFLDALCLSLKEKIMFTAGHRYEVFGSVIIPNTIKMMNNPSFRQWLVMNLLPHQNMFKDIMSSLICSRVVRCPDHNISVTMHGFTTFPSITMTVSTRWFKHACFPKMLCTAISTSQRFWLYQFATVKTCLCFLSHMFHYITLRPRVQCL